MDSLRKDGRLKHLLNWTAMLVALGLMWSGCAPSSGSGAATVRPETKLTREELLALGERTFMMRCANCHGMHGEGGPIIANPHIQFNTGQWQQRHTDDEMYSVIKTGRGSMPAFGDVLSEDELSAVVAHIRTLKTE